MTLPARRILVLVPSEDQADRAIGLTCELAERHPTEALVLRVLEESNQPRATSGALDLQRVRDLLVESEQRELDRLVEPLRAAADRVTTSVVWGVPWERVLELVERHEIHLVVKPARGLSHSGRVFFGATALHLFRKCPCPVWVVGEKAGLPARILAAVDPGGDGVRRSVGSRVVDWASHLARLAGARLEVISCWRAPAAELLEGALSRNELAAYVEDARVRARRGLDQIVEGATAVLEPDQVRLVDGDAREALPRIADLEGFDLVVMGTLGRDGPVGEALGETAELVVRAVRSSIFTVSPQSDGPL